MGNWRKSTYDWYIFLLTHPQPCESNFLTFYFNNGKDGGVGLTIEIAIDFIIH